MKANTSKETMKRDKACRFVLASILLQGHALARDLIRFFGPPPAEGPPLDFLEGILAFGRKLKESIGRLVAADKLLFIANAAHMVAVKVRDEDARELSRQIVAVRGACRFLLTDLTVEEYGFDQRTAQDPAPLLVQSERVVNHLVSGEATSAGSVFPNDDFDPAKYAGPLEASAKKLRVSLDAVADTRRQAEQALLEKQSMTEEYDNLFLHGARMFESYCRLVGKVDLADRLRPSETRRGSTEVEPDDVPDSDLDPFLQIDDVEEGENQVPSAGS